MEGHIGQVHPHVLDLLEELFGKVEPGRGGGGGAHLPGVDGLVPLRVLELRLDIGGQRHPAQALQQLQENAVVVEADQAVASLADLQDLGGEKPVSEGEPGPLSKLLSRPDQALPDLIAPVYQQQDLYRAAAGLPVAQQPGGQHPGIVEHQTVAGPQQGGQVIKVQVPGGPGLLVQHHEPGAVPPVQRGLGDELLGEVIVKIRCLQTILPAFL